MYFHARGVVENVRIMFYIGTCPFHALNLECCLMDRQIVLSPSRPSILQAGVPYVDFRFPVDCTTFARPEYDAVAKVSPSLSWCAHGVLLLLLLCCFRSIVDTFCDFIFKGGVLLTANMNRVPVLEVRFDNGTKPISIGQSKSIERFVARQHGFMGQNEFDAARVDMICEHMYVLFFRICPPTPSRQLVPSVLAVILHCHCEFCLFLPISGHLSICTFGSGSCSMALCRRDIKQRYHDAKARRKGEELLMAKSAFMLTDLPKWMSKLEATVTGTPGHAVGSQLSLADIVIQQNLRDYFDDKAAVRIYFVVYIQRHEIPSSGRDV